MVRLEDAVIVAAHPDDEILWFSSILDTCKAVVVCFGQSSSSNESWDEGRAALMERFPLTKARFLKVRQSDAFQAADWKNPVETDSGLQLRRPIVTYAENAQSLRRLLESELRDATTVLTHNPWGEYGNEEHVQVFSVVEQLRRKLGFDLYVNGYVSNRSLKLMSRNSPRLVDEPLVFETNLELAAEMMRIYLEYNCWTWRDDYEWPRWEIFYRVQSMPSNGVRHMRTTSSVPLNYLGIDFNRHALVQKAIMSVPDSVRVRIKRLLGRGTP